MTVENTIAAIFSPVPESRDTLLAQQKQLVKGDRHVQMFPKGHEEIPPLPGFGRWVTPKGDVFHFRPDAVSVVQLQHASATGRENELLGLGPVTKHAAMIRALHGEKPTVVVERDKDGTEVRSAAGTKNITPLQLAHMQAVKSEGHKVGLEKPSSLIKSRGK